MAVTGHRRIPSSGEIPCRRKTGKVCAEADLVEVSRPFHRRDSTTLSQANGTVTLDQYAARLQNHASSPFRVRSHNSKKDFESDEIDIKFYNRLVIYLQAKQFTANTVGKIIKELKTVLRRAEKNGVNPNTAYKDFTVDTEAVDNVTYRRRSWRKSAQPI